ncbi:Kelch-type beta propeller [Parasponia andersonii]|uniref:Kelch-type beta propeller n=1 Tax=Parasponia andersonii TaxID=3476 RepID=A0A2P5DCI4_PARAD|nr:Kelch-type beta propeller [Parasponia andersonii]
MGSFPSPPRPVSTLQPFAEYNSSCKSRVYVAFRYRDPQPSESISIMIYSYDPSNNSWSLMTLIPGLIENHGLKDFAMVSIGDWIYIIGGRLFHQQRAQMAEDESNLSTEVDIEVLSSVLRYNVRTDQWSKCASLAIPRYDFACTVCEDKIYVAGGKSMLASVTGVSSAEVYEPTTDEWTPLPNMSTLRYKCVAVTWQGKIHVVGGFALKADSDCTRPYNFMAERSSAEVYDTRAREWDLVRGMWQLDVPPNQIVAVDGKLLSSGDCLKVWKGHIEAYDWEQNIWNEVDGSRLWSLNSPISNDSNHDYNRGIVQQLYLTIAPIGTSLYFLAGYRMDGGDLPRTKSIVHKFDTSATSNAWASFEPMEEDGEKVLCSHCCIVHLSD